MHKCQKSRPEAASRRSIGTGSNDLLNSLEREGLLRGRLQCGRLPCGNRRRGLGSLLALVRKIVAVPEILVELAGQLSSAGAEGGPAAFEEEDCDQAALRRIGPGGKPAKTGSLVGAGSGLAEDG